MELYWYLGLCIGVDGLPPMGRPFLHSLGPRNLRVLNALDTRSPFLVCNRRRAMPESWPAVDCSPARTTLFRNHSSQETEW